MQMVSSMLYAQQLLSSSSEGILCSVQARVSEELVGTTMKVKLLEVDEETERLVFSNRRASSETQMAGHKVRDLLGIVLPSNCTAVGESVPMPHAADCNRCKVRVA